MSVILALDSSSDACSVALLQEQTLLGHYELASKSHTQRLLPMVDDLLRSQGLGVKQLDAIAFGRGPGSFTGLRICMGVVQGLAYGAQRPVIPVSTLEAMALQVYRSRPQWQGPVLIALDARMEDVYWAVFQRHANGELQCLSGEHVMSPAAVVTHAALASVGALVAAGSGLHYAPLAALAASKAVESWLDMHPRAEDIALLAAPRYSAGQAESIDQAQLVYLRDTVSWQKRQRIRPPQGDCN